MKALDLARALVAQLEQQATEQSSWPASPVGRVKLDIQTIELDPESLTRLRRGAMARFCASLTAEDWLQLETLSARLRNCLLVLAVQQVLKRRTVGAERGVLEGKR